jgi:hypothetical protein
MAEQDRDDLLSKLAKAGWHVGGWTRNPDGTVEVKLRLAPETSGEPERSIFGTDVDDAIRKELQRLEAENTASEPP